ncbi:uncharacterized protein BT62DRAFT_1075177 [Guyanagaster necrorhizus]|uniref:Uncharacterized protein n=1 Tax=Guyanagaster necrorhizus TaxID=856835 RepID=A0A9P7VWI9_9AGAR|nr:uncharacterized protein BT62DRAFT_1075177 [Guyanagaster necrorhizus MCA 3950]KAG7447852.1 hypothetical protein BT62DRAFT_1075177 [Guyanagaster necrorhizus MCA 3950]
MSSQSKIVAPFPHGGNVDRKRVSSTGNRHERFIFPPQWVAYMLSSRSRVQLMFCRHASIRRLISDTNGREAMAPNKCIWIAATVLQSSWITISSIYSVPVYFHIFFWRYAVAQTTIPDRLASTLVFVAWFTQHVSVLHFSEEHVILTPLCTNLWLSSLATIFACIWIAIHPNVPGPHLMKRGWFFTSVLRRTELMIVTIFAPEVITIWALRQYFAARSIRRLSSKMTLTHGFLVSMGVFVYSDESPVTRQNLEDDPRLVDLLSEIDKKEIDDRSKGDGLSKGLAILQATWFILQCAARIARNLPITILETVAIGYAVFTVINYWAWWHTPLQAGLPSPSILDSRPQHFRLLSTFFGGDVIEHVAGPSKEEGAPRLWSGHPNNDTLFYVVTGGALLGTLFGAVHCAAWRSHFATSIEKNIWRVSSLYIAFIPIPIIVTTFTAEKLAAYFGFTERDQDNPWFGGAYRLLWILFYMVYIVARGFLLLEPFLAMRSLPPGAFVNIEWIDFLPHI